MKNLFILFAAVILTANVFAQAPQKMSYQAVIRNSSNALVSSTAVGMRISILQTTASGTAVYVETQTATTNANGLVSIEIGAGTAVTATFAGIDWSAGPYFIKTETDPAGGTSYSITGTSQLLSVPYALSAAGIANPNGLAIPRLTTAQIAALPVSPAPFGTIIYNTTANAFVGYRTRVNPSSSAYGNSSASANTFDLGVSQSIKQTFNNPIATTQTNFSPNIFPTSTIGVAASGNVTLNVYTGTPGSETQYASITIPVNTNQTNLMFSISGTFPAGPGYYTLTTDATARLRLMTATSTINGSIQQGYDQNNTLLGVSSCFQFSINGSFSTTTSGWTAFQ